MKEKIVKVKKTGQFLVFDSAKGWINSGGTATAFSPSPKIVKFYATVEDAKADGFSPSDVQKAALGIK